MPAFCSALNLCENGINANRKYITSLLYGYPLPIQVVKKILGASAIVQSHLKSQSQDWSHNAIKQH